LCPCLPAGKVRDKKSKHETDIAGIQRITLMIHSILIFLITAFISFMGSVQLGPVNLAIMQDVLNGRKKAGLIIGAGVCLPEFIYSAFALFASAWLLKRHTLLVTLEWAIVPVMIGLGILNMFKKKKQEEISEKGKSTDFFKGFILSALNPQLLPFWLAILVMLNGYEFFRITTIADKLCFVAGTGAGEFGLISLVVWLTARHREFLLSKLHKWNLNKVFGWFFIVLALVQALKLLIRPVK
jgi:threonine/homoserine/homoserine lactone efflux protein